MITSNHPRRRRLMAIVAIAVTSFALNGCSEMEGRTLEGERQRMEGEADRLKQDATDRAEAEAKRRAEERAREEVNNRLGR